MARPPPCTLRTLLDILGGSVALHPDAAAPDDGDRTPTYGEQSAEVERLRGRLNAAGIGRGDRAPSASWARGVSVEG